MLSALATATFLSWSIITVESGSDRPCWPPPPDVARIEYVGEIRCDDLKAKTSFWGKLSRFVGGRSEDDEISLPFDLVARDDGLFAVCQNIPALVRIDPEERNFHLLECKELPFAYPVSLCDGGDGLLFITDSELGAVFKYLDGEIEPFITEGLSRPTGIAAQPSAGRIYIVDTGEHNLKVFDYDGQLVSISKDDSTSQMNFPVSAEVSADGDIYVIDALNYLVRTFDSDGNLHSSFGQEGDGPGSFSRSVGCCNGSSRFKRLRVLVAVSPVAGPIET